MRKSIRLSLWITLLGVTAIRTVSPLTVTVVQGHSMEPTLRPGAVSLLDRSYYRTHPVSRGDVVVLRREDETLIKSAVNSLDTALDGLDMTFIDRLVGMW